MIGAYITGLLVGLVVGALIVVALWDRDLAQQRTAAADELATVRLPRIHHLDDARRSGAHRKEHTR